MGFLWWKNNNNTKSDESRSSKPDNPSSSTINSSGGGVVPGLNGAELVKRPNPTEVTVFEFGSVAGSVDKVTLAGYCPVSEELEPCRWEILPAQDSGAPQFRVVF